MSVTRSLSSFEIDALRIKFKLRKKLHSTPNCDQENTNSERMQNLQVRRISNGQQIIADKLT